MTFDVSDGVWQKVLNLPAGTHNYKVALNGSWDEAYPPGMADITLPLAAAGTVKFYYDHETHWVADNVTKVIAVAVGSFQSELGCPSDWDPSCLRSWLKDTDGDGIYTFETTGLPQGSYAALVAIDESWDESYGLNGQPGVNIPFEVSSTGDLVTFTYVAATHILTITTPSPATPEPTATEPPPSPEPTPVPTFKLRLPMIARDATH